MYYTGQTIDKKYRIARLLGEGGMGSVYLAEHVLIGKRVAVKFLIAEFVRNEEAVKRFFREARAAATIDHKNIIDVMDMGISAQGEPYIVMEYLEGESLADLMARCGPIDFAAALGIAVPVLSALAAAHDKGIVHRDLKPENVFIVSRKGEEPLIKLIDFGISKFTGESAQETKLTQTGALLGTPEYMSPEQARGKGDLDHRADIYSVGLMLYEMLGGELPFTGENYNTLLINILTTQPRSILEVAPTLPLEAERPVMQAIAKLPEQRFQSAREMLEVLRGTASFCNRNAQLVKLVGKISKSGVASGDLGPDRKLAQSDIAEVVFSEMSETFTPSAWSKTLVRPSKRRPVIPGLVALASLALLLGVTVFFAVSPSTPPKIPSEVVSDIHVADTMAKSGEDSIKIHIQGTAPGSKIYYNGSLVTANPFWVKSSKTMVNLRVEKEGFLPFKLMVEPSSNRIVKVVMTPVVAKTSEDDSPESRSSSTRRDGGKSSSRKNSAPKRLRKSRKTQKQRMKKAIRSNSSRSKYTERFE